MAKTGKTKTKVNKWFKNNYYHNAAILVIFLREAYKGKKKMDGFYHLNIKSKKVRYEKSYIHKWECKESFVEYMLSQEVLKKIYNTESKIKKIEYIPVYNWLIYQLANLVYEGMTGKEDFNSNPEQGVKLLMKINKKKVDEFLSVVAEFFIEENGK
jgi:hypothetical protein